MHYTKTCFNNISMSICKLLIHSQQNPHLLSLYLLRGWFLFETNMQFTFLIDTIWICVYVSICDGCVCVCAFVVEYSKVQSRPVRQYYIVIILTTSLSGGRNSSHMQTFTKYVQTHHYHTHDPGFFVPTIQRKRSCLFGYGCG